MSEPWIRVHANLLSKPIVTRAAESLGVSRHEALGLLVAFWGGVSQHATNGAVFGLSDMLLESWAGWHRRRGRFAEFIRTAHLDAEGRVNEWDDYAGKLEQRRAKERERLRNKRATPAQPLQDVGTHARERNDTKRELPTPTAKASRRKPRVEGLEPADGTRTSWLSPTCAVWEGKFGAGSFATIAGQAAKVLSPLRAGSSDEQIAERLGVYLERTEPQFVSLNRFAATFGQWVSEPLVDENGLPTARAAAILLGAM